MAKKRTPEEEKRYQEGKEYIKTREKLASEQGITSKRAGELLIPVEAGKAAEPVTEEGGRTVAEVQAEKAKIGEKFRETGVFEEPKRVELNADKYPAGELAQMEKLPVVGPSIGAVTSVLYGALEKGYFDDILRKDYRAKEGFIRRDPLLQSPETLRQLGLQEIQKQVMKEGLTTREAFGTLIEAIPVAGGLISKYASGLIETPGGNAQTITDNINKYKELSSRLGENAQTGKIDPYFALEQLNLYEQDIARLEMRLKLLINASPRLRADADTVNKMETEILGVKTQIYQSKQRAAGGVVIPPTNEQIYLELEKYK